MNLEDFQDFQRILCNKLQERIDRIRENYQWLYSCQVDDLAREAIASGRGATTEDEKIAAQLYHETNRRLNEYCEPILREHELAMRALVDFANTH